MELLHERCAALDIGKKNLKACVRTPSPKGKRSRRQEIRTFATTTNALLELRDWLVGERVSLVVMEATGDYWRGAFYLLEDDLEVILDNAAHAKGTSCPYEFYPRALSCGWPSHCSASRFTSASVRLARCTTWRHTPFSMSSRTTNAHHSTFFASGSGKMCSFTLRDRGKCGIHVCR